MKPDEKTAFASVMKGLAINSGVDLTADILRLYFDALKSFSIEQVTSAAQNILMTWKYNRMPPLAVLMDGIEGKQSVEDKALVTAHEIVSHLKIWGSSKYPDLKGDPVALHLMSTRWNYKDWAANVLESELTWWVKEFCDAYRAYDESDVPLQIDASDKVKEIAHGIFEDA